MRARLGGRPWKALALLVLLAVVFASGCDLAILPWRPVCDIPEQLDNGWDVASLDAVGIDAAAIARLADQIEDGRYGTVHSCLIVKDSALVYEKYFHGFNRDMLHRLYSVTKSVTSSLIGIAIEDGLVSGVDQLVMAYFPEYVSEGWDEAKNAITLQHLLIMSSGLQYDENSYPYSDSRNSWSQMTATGDWMKWALDQPLVAEPGTRFNYSTGNSHLFAGIIYKTAGVHVTEFAEERLFGPLGIDDYFWYMGDGYPATGGSFGGLKLRPRDMAKFGTMYLNDGRWKGEQVVPKEWVSESVIPRISSWGDSQYGYQWWLYSRRVSGEDIDWFAARGYGDQLIAVVPSLDMVIVITSGNEGQGVGLDGAVMDILQAAL